MEWLGRSMYNESVSGKSFSFMVCICDEKIGIVDDEVVFQCNHIGFGFFTDSLQCEYTILFWGRHDDVRLLVQNI